MNPVVTFQTSLGSFDVELYQDKVPGTVQNFLGYVNDKFYDNTIFHRVIAGFMVQGGGYTQDGTEKPTKAPIKNESGKGPKNIKYGIAMARTSDPDSATAQFYVNVKDNAFLDSGKYCAFGLVTSGQDTIDKIENVAVKERGPISEHQPVQTVVIQSARLKAPQA
jgi:cyclophilin family peptidyl-prolyl cis-trans isomerase